MAFLIIVAAAWQLLGLLCIPISGVWLSKRTQLGKTIYLASALLLIAQTCVFIYYGTFEGAFNFSGHGRYEEVPNYLFLSFFWAGSLSCSMWVFHFIASNKQ